MSGTPPPRAHLIERAMGLAPGAGAALPPAAPPPQGTSQGPFLGQLGATPPAAELAELAARVTSSMPAEARLGAPLAPAPLATQPAARPAGGQAVADPVAVAAPPGSPPASPRAAPASAPPIPAPQVHGPIGLDQLRQAGMVILHATGQRHRLAEEFAIIQNQIMRTLRSVAPAAATEGRCARAVMITSAKPGEGKTFTSLNVAASIATNSTTPVLLVDADGKRGSMSELLGVGQQTGLRAFAFDPGRYPPRPMATAIERLSFLPFGAAPPGAGTVPSGESVAAAVQRLAAAMPRHVLIIDMPPCLSTSEPSFVAPVVGQVVVVVRAEHTQRNEVEAALDMIDACPNLQLMLNQARLSSNDSFGAYGYGVYGAYGVEHPGA